MDTVNIGKSDLKVSRIGLGGAQLGAGFGLTDAGENIRAIARFVTELSSSVTAVNVLPYHRFGLSKYEMLDREYELGELKPPTQEELDAVLATFEALDLDCEIVT